MDSQGIELKGRLLSRIVDVDDLMLHPVVFVELDKEWGPHMVDRLASFHSCQLPRRNSHCWNPGSEAVDAFSVNWAGEVNWWCLLVPLIPRIIHNAQVCADNGTLIKPCWLSAHSGL